jgi:glycosyltransferase involved in cell wall biosynthesis
VTAPYRDADLNAVGNQHAAVPDSIAIGVDRPHRTNGRIWVDGKLFRQNDDRFYVKGFSYGPFAPNSTGEPLPERAQLRADLAIMQSLGGNTLRLYSEPSPQVLDDLHEFGIHAIVDIPWEKHRCFFEDWSAREAARESVTRAATSIGEHPALLAISVVNEIPNDVVRFYGHARIEKFLTELSDTVKQRAPDCLTTFANYPTTEFLQPEGFDFCCFNVYLHDASRLGAYLDRLQHIAGELPLVLSEFGLDSIREGERVQSELLAAHVRTVFEHGVAGSVIFSFTDEWFTGGRLLDQWGFGITRADRSFKLSADAVRQAWQQAPFSQNGKLPKVSVVVCAYNAARTLPECLRSLGQIDYPDYEVILVDDGSKDNTPAIAAEFPQIVYVRQKNRGLSVARNVGAERATGEIVAYTDADCVADADWLRCLVQAMENQQVDAIGGPNITPHNDGWSAQCVAVSPGNPSHVMLDDCRAEHIPGCNMAFRRNALMRLGGFDPQYRQAGDDVDMCWRLIDEGGVIGYAPGGFVWHHRRETVGAYLKQQIGYGKAEALLHFKHPQRFSVAGHCSWHGRIYGSGTAGLPIIPERIYYGPFGLAPFQVVYRHNHYGMWACVTWLEWHIVAAFFFALGFLFWPLWVITAAMWSATLAVTINAAREATLPKGAPWWCRPLVAVLHLVQPAIREWRRVTYDLRLWRPKLSDEYLAVAHPVQEIGAHVHDLYWESRDGSGREQLLSRLVQESRDQDWLGVLGNAWASWDVKLAGDLWHTLHVYTATEQLADNRRFTRARCVAQPTLVNRVLSIAALVWSAAALTSLSYGALAIGFTASVVALVQNVRSRRQCLAAVTSLVARAGAQAGLTPVLPRGEASAPDAELPRSPNMVESPAQEYTLSPLAGDPMTA